eukprot:6901206-Prymnesium_polylepis.4
MPVRRTWAYSLAHVKGFRSASCMRQACGTSAGGLDSTDSTDSTDSRSLRQGLESGAPTLARLAVAYKRITPGNAG